MIKNQKEVKLKMAEENVDYGYDVVDVASAESGARDFVKSLKAKGDEVEVRIATKPVYKHQHWMVGANGKKTTEPCGGEACAHCGKDVPKEEKLDKDTKFAWGVIDRADGRAKIFIAKISVAIAIKELSEMKEKDGKPTWGDPMTFDIRVTRTEITGQYYKTVALPSTLNTPMTKEELKLIKEAEFDLLKALEGSKKSNTLGDYGTDADLETAPAEENVLEDDGDDEDKLPF